MKSVTLHDYKRRLLRVLVHIQHHLDEPLLLHELAGLACFSPFHFHRVFRGMVGESLKQHVRRLRLERAASQLRLGRRPVTDIALDAGYLSHEAFTRSFRSAFGLSPSQFRSVKRRATAAPAPSGIHYRNRGRTAGFKTTATDLKVRVAELKPIRVAFLRNVGPYSTVGAAWDRLLPALGAQGWIGPETLFIGLCHDDPDITAPQRIRYDACVSVGTAFDPAGEIGVQTIHGGGYAVATHCGPYRRLGVSYAKLLGQWLPRSGRELAALPCFESYLNDPNSTEPAELLTDIYAPLAPRPETRG